YERRAIPVLPVTRLLTDEHRYRALPACAEHGLRRVLPERTGAAASGCPAQLRERGARRDEVGRGIRHPEPLSRRCQGEAFASGITRTRDTRGGRHTDASSVLCGRPPGASKTCI